MLCWNAKFLYITGDAIFDLIFVTVVVLFANSGYGHLIFEIQMYSLISVSVGPC